jgi:hypothetical protein
VAELGPEALTERRQLVVILRLVAATTGRLLYGEVIDVEAGPTGRFVGWRGMTNAVRTWLSSEIEKPADSDPRPVTYESETPVER